MSKTIQAIRGMNDILPETTPYWQHIEAHMRQVLAAYGYREIRLPLLEKTELFKRSIGEVTDIVEKEMYSFDDRNGDNLSLRPEGTASCVRAGIQNGLLHNQLQRLWYMGPMFRHERPQKGRYRQFHQIGVEAFGMAAAEIDAELIQLSHRLWQRLGLAGLRLEINSLGSNTARAEYRIALVAYLKTVREQLDADSQRRLESNPLRILDSKNPDTQALLADAPRLNDFLDPESREHFQTLCRHLDASNIEYRINHGLVRGLDYYQRTVFEWITDRLGAQGTVCAGGRFDGLVEQIGGRPTPAVGFALGLERLVSLLQDEQGAGVDDGDPHAYLVMAGDAARQAGLALAEAQRDTAPTLRLQVDCQGGSLKSQFKRADRSGAGAVLILGEREVEEHTIGIKYLREDRQQETISQQQLGAALAALTSP